MAQKKKPRKRPPKPPTDGKQVMRQFRQMVEGSNADGARPNAYSDAFGVRAAIDNKARELESGLKAPGQLEAFRCATLGNMRAIQHPYERGKPSRNTVTFMKGANVAMRNTFMNAISMMLTDVMVETHDECDPYDVDQVYDIAADVENAMPSKYHQDDAAVQGRTHIRYQHADPTTTCIQDVIDWDRLLVGDDLNQWAKAAMALTEHMTMDERIAQMDTIRDDVISRLLEIMAEYMPKAARDTETTMYRLGYDLSLAKAAKPSERPKTMVPVAAKPDADALKGLFQPGQHAEGIQSRLPSMPQTYGRTSYTDIGDRTVAEPWMYQFLMAMEFSIMGNVDRIGNRLLSEFSYSDLTYATLSLLAHESKKGRSTCVSEILALTLMLNRLTSLANQDLIRDFDGGDPAFTFNPYAMHEYGKEMNALLAERRDRLEEQGRSVQRDRDEACSIVQIAAVRAGVLLPSKLNVRMHLKKLFLLSGYSEEESIALCGYLEGLSSGRAHTVITDVYLPDGEDANQDEQPEADPSIAIQAELEAKYDQAVRMADQRVDEARSKVLKEQKRFRHEAMGLEARIAELSEMLDRKDAEIRGLKSENRRLGDDLAQIAMLLPEETDDQADDSDESGRQWPDGDTGSQAKMIVYGGSSKWTAEQARRFPNVTFFGADVTPNDDAVMGADIVMCNTFVIKHKQFWKIQKAARKSGKDIAVFPRRGINNGSAQIIDTYMAFMGLETGKEDTRNA